MRRLNNRGGKVSVLVVHNRYRQRGGEDAVFEAEAALLEERGHRVRRLAVDNRQLPEAMAPRKQLRLARNTIWSSKAARAMRRAIRDFQPDVVHLHNTFPQLSPSVYQACSAEGVPIVQTLHNYRFICPASTLLRDGRPCHDCVGLPIPLPGVVHACYQDSHLRSAVVATMLSVQRATGALSQIAAFIALNEFGRRMFVRGGLPADRLVVKPNFVDLPSEANGAERDGFLYVGRLAPEKGLRTLLSAWSMLPDGPRLTIMGEGPLKDDVELAASRSNNIDFRGPCGRREVLDEMASALALVFPSEWYEGCPLTVIEAFASGLPVIASRLGSLQEMVHPGRTGLHFEAASAKDLAEKVRWMADRPTGRTTLVKGAREEYELQYTAERSYQRLLEIYGAVR